MLQRLDIQNIALIDKLCVELGEGLNVLTGETGAGKSIIIDSINAILGERLPKDLIRTGTDKASVQAVFTIDETRFSDLIEIYGFEVEEDGSLLISRDVNITGKNSCRINGRLVTVTALKEVGQRLLDIHGQYDNHSLLNSSKHLDLLDAFAGETIADYLKEYKVKFTEFKSKKQKLNELTSEKGEKEKKIDLLKFQTNEIEKADLKSSEEEELENRRIILSNSEKIATSLSACFKILREGDAEQETLDELFSKTLNELSSISKYGDKYLELTKKFEDIYYQLQDSIDEIRDEIDKIEHNPKGLDDVVDRLDLINKLKRKYGKSVADVLSYYEKKSKELEELENSEIITEKIKNEVDKLSAELFSISMEIHKIRKIKAEDLNIKITEELSDMEMKKAKFETKLIFLSEKDVDGYFKFTKNGLDEVEFLISTNLGEPLKPLAKIASGGEMSRIMLAIKRILASVDHMPTLIFDEIDTGISGRAAQKVGEKLAYISKSHQVLCVTHLAQIAVMADVHLLIEKNSDHEKTLTMVEKLENDSVRKEIARILGGSNLTEITLSHAEEMLLQAQNFKATRI